MKVFSIAGWSGSGKTTLILHLAAAFKQKDRKVLAVKNIPHKYHLEPEAKDSFKFLNAGCSEVFLVARDEIVNMQRNDTQEKIFEILEGKANGNDIVLLEGLLRDDIPVIEVFDARQHEAPKIALEKLSALVTVSDLNQGKDKGKIKNQPDTGEPGEPVPVFDANDINGIVQFMEGYYG